MSQDYTEGVAQRYLDNFKRGQGFGAEDRARYDKYKEATKGLDADVAFQALEGGMTFGDPDRARYDALMKERENSQPKPEPEKPAPPKGSGNNNNATGGKGAYSGAVNTVSGEASNVGGISGSRDKNAVIYGDGNTVDNSEFSQHFGDEVRIFNAGGRGGHGHGGGVPTGQRGLYSTPVSDATMAGFYGTSDTGRTAAENIAKYAGQNELWQTRQNKQWKKTGNFDYTSDKYRATNPTAMQERIDRQPIIQRDRSTLAYNHLYGDLDKYLAPEWVMPAGPAVIKDDIDKIADGFRDDLT